MRITLCLVILVLALSAIAAKKAITEIRTRDIGKSVLIIGELGQPLGEVITVKGRMWTVGLWGDEFEVDTVNGKPLKEGCVVRISGAKSWPTKTAITLRGNEFAIIRFSKQSETNLREEKFIPQQFAERFFKVEEIISHKNLNLEKDK